MMKSIKSSKQFPPLGDLEDAEPRKDWKQVVARARKIDPLKGQSEKFLSHCREFRDNFTFEYPRNNEDIKWDDAGEQ